MWAFQNILTLICHSDYLQTINHRYEYCIYSKIFQEKYLRGNEFKGENHLRKKGIRHFNSLGPVRVCDSFLLNVQKPYLKAMPRYKVWLIRNYLMCTKLSLKHRTLTKWCILGSCTFAYLGFTDKRTDVWSWDFIIWKTNYGLWSGLDCEIKGVGLIMSNFWGQFFKVFMDKKLIYNFLKMF